MDLDFYVANVYLGEPPIVIPHMRIDVTRGLVVIRAPALLRWLVRTKHIKADEVTAFGTSPMGCVRVERADGLVIKMCGDESERIVQAMYDAGFSRT